MAKFETLNKRRAGAYVRFQSKGSNQRLSDTQGTVALMVPNAKYAPADVWIEADANTDYSELFLEIPKEIQEVLKSCSNLLIYCPEGSEGKKATGVAGTLNIEAVHAGSLGNKLSIEVNPLEVGNQYVIRYDGQTVEEFNADELPYEGKYVKLSGTAPLEPKVANLSGGKDVKTSMLDGVKFSQGLDGRYFTHVVYTSEDETQVGLIINKVKELRDNGKPVFLVTANTKANHEGVISIANGVILDNGEELTADLVAYGVAGLQATAGVESLTYKRYPLTGASASVEPLSNDDVIEHLNEGQIVFVKNRKGVVIESDINTLTELTEEKGEIFTKNRINRITAIIERQVMELFEKYYIGTVPNNEDGREQFKASLIATVLDPLAQRQAINYNPDDLVIYQGQGKDEVVVDLALVVADAMEKLYMTVTCH